MPAGPNGTKAHLDYWLYGIVKTASQLGNAGLFLRAAQEASVRKFLSAERLLFRDTEEPKQILRLYNERLDQRGVLHSFGLPCQLSFKEDRLEATEDGA